MAETFTLDDFQDTKPDASLSFDESDFEPAATKPSAVITPSLKLQTATARSLLDPNEYYDDSATLADRLAGRGGSSESAANVFRAVGGTAAKAVDYAGNVARGFVTDIVNQFSGGDNYAENLDAALRGGEMPVDVENRQLAQTHPNAATAAMTAQGALKSAPLLAAGGLPSLAQRAIALGFTAQMVAGVKQLATDYGTEIGKPMDQRDPAKLAELRSDLIQTGVFAPLAGAYGARPGPKPTTKGASNASRITSPEGVSQPEIRPSVGQEAPLRQSGETPGTRQVVPPETPLGPIEQRPLEVAQEPGGLTAPALEDLPPPEKGTVRLFSGGDSSYASTNPVRASGFGEVRYVDVPKDVASKARQKALDSPDQGISGTEGDHLLPNDWVKKQQPVAVPKPETPDLTPEGSPAELGGAIETKSISDQQKSKKASMDMAAAMKADLMKATKPQPDWRVVVQQPEIQGQNPYVQIIDPRQQENAQSPSVEMLRRIGHDVPDFTKLPTGTYSWKEVTEKLASATPSKNAPTGAGQPALIAGEQIPVPGAAKRVVQKENVAGRETPATAAGEVETPGSRPATPVRRNFFIRPRSDGVPDILDEVQEHGGIRAPGETAGGEYDAYKESMTGTASLLRRQKSGLAVDEMVQAIQKNYPRITTPDQLFEAIKGASAQRDKLRTTGGGYEAQTARFWTAATKMPKMGLQKVNVDNLIVGQKFRLKAPGVSHEELEVSAVNPDDGTVTVKDGPSFGTQDLPEGLEIYVKKGTLSKTPKSELFTAAETPFNLAGEQAKFVEPTQTKTAFGGETLTQNDLFAIRDIVREVDPGKSANAAERMYGGSAAAAKTIKHQMEVMARDPESYRSFDKKQKARLQEVLNLLNERAFAPATAEVGPGAVAMGGDVPHPKAQDFGTTGAGQDIYGVAERVRKGRAAAGQVAPVPTGQGVSDVEAVKWGQDLERSGADAEKSMQDFERTKAISFDGMALARGHGETLAAVARNAESKFGTDSPGYRAAQKSLSDWDARSKAMQTEWHKIGMAQQGETDIDTGSFTGINREFRRITGRDLNPPQARTAKKLAKDVTNADAATEPAKAGLQTAIDGVTEKGKPVKVAADLDSQRKAFADYKSGDAMTPLQIKTLWTRAKTEYIDKGNDSRPDIIHKLSIDLALPVKDIVRGLAQTKRVRRAADEVWQKQRQARMLKEVAKNWVNHATETWLQKTLPTVARTLFTLKTGLHGTVAMGTHAPLVVATHPIIFKNNFGRMYHLVVSPEFYEMQQHDMARRPNYTVAQRAGLVNDMSKMEDFSDPALAQGFPKMAAWFKAKLNKVHLGRAVGMGTRGYSVLKILRQDLFDNAWNKLAESEKSPELASAIADSVNHITGVTKTGGGAVGKYAHYALFAPKLEASRVAVIATDLVRAVNSLLKMQNMSDAEKWFATNQFKEKASIFAVFTGLLLANQQLNNLFGDKKKINGVPAALGGGGWNPMQSDFMKFRVAGMNFAWGSPFLTMTRLPLRIYQIGAGTGGKTRFLIYPDESMYKTAGSYLRTQASPFASPVVSLITKGDYQDRPLPQIPGYGTPPPVPKRLVAEGVKPYTWKEFGLGLVLPIPFEEGANEVFHYYDLGQTAEARNALLKSFAITSIMAGTGGRVAEDWNKEQTPVPGSSPNP